MTEMLKGVAEMVGIMSPSRAKVQSTMRLSADAQKLINRLINEFSHSSLRCQSMTYYFKQQERCLFGVADLHLWSSVADAMWARSLLEYMNLRGGLVQLDPIDAPEFHEWGNVDHSIECILSGKKMSYQLVLQLYKVAIESDSDPHLADFVEVNLVRPLLNLVRKMGILHSQAILACCEGSVGEYQFDKDVSKNLAKIILVNKLVRPDKFSVVY